MNSDDMGTRHSVVFYVYDEVAGAVQQGSQNPLVKILQGCQLIEKPYELGAFVVLVDDVVVADEMAAALNAYDCVEAAYVETHVCKGLR